jgi:hypothetical protein
MPEPHLRAGDTDREAVAAALGTHMAAGRLTLAEFDERLARAYAARTLGELAELTTDLPALTPTAPRPVTASTDVGPVPRPAPTVCGPRSMPMPRPMAAGSGHGHPEHSWRAWLSTSATVLAIYLVISLASWDFSYFWPMWVIGPWGVALLAQRIGGHGASSREERRQPGR